MSLFEGHVSITNRRVLFWGFIFLTLSGSLMAAFFMQTSNESVAFDELLVKFAAGTPLSRVKEVSNRIGLTVIEQMAVYDPDLYRVQVPANVKVDEAIEQYGQNSEVIGARKIERELLVKFAAGTPLSRVEEVSNRIGSTVLEQMAVGDPDLYRVQVPANVKVDEAIEQYAQNSEVIRATKIPPIWINEVEALFVPDELVVKFRPGRSRQKIDEVNKLLGATTISRAILADPDVYLIRLPKGSNLDDARRRYRAHPDVSWVEKNSRVFPHNSGGKGKFVGSPN